MRLCKIIYEQKLIHCIHIHGALKSKAYNETSFLTACFGIVMRLPVKFKYELYEKNFNKGVVIHNSVSGMSALTLVL